MKQVLLVGLGGFVGSIARYVLGALLAQQTTGWRFRSARAADQVRRVITAT